MVSMREWFGFAPKVSTRAPRVGMLTATDGRDILLNDPAGWEVNAPWLWWLGPAGGDGSGGPWGNPPPGAGGGGEREAGSIGAVTRCTSIICDTIAGLPWQVLRGWERLDTPSWIADPQGLRADGRVVAGSLSDIKLSAVEFWAWWIQSALWWGDGYVYAPVRGADGSPSPPLWHLNPHKVEILDGRYVANGVELEPGSVIHLRGEPPYRGGHGTGVLTKHWPDLALALQVREYAAGQYTSGVPAGYLKSSQPRMDATQAADLRNKWLDQHGGSARSIAVLNATTEFVALSGISPIDAQLDGAKTWALRDIAIAFGVPPYMLGVPGDSSTYANVESRMIELRAFTLLPWIRRIESTLDAQFARGTDLRVNTAGLERADTKTRYEAYALAISNGIVTRDEVRSLENLPPLGAEADPNLPAAVDAQPAGDTMSNPPTNPPNEEGAP